MRPRHSKKQSAQAPASVSACLTTGSQAHLGKQLALGVLLRRIILRQRRRGAGLRAFFFPLVPSLLELYCAPCPGLFPFPLFFLSFSCLYFLS